MINKKDGSFDDDEKLLQAFNLFCGSAFDNARLDQASLNLTLQLRSFI
jgi:GAF domain-containing protein